MQSSMILKIGSFLRVRFDRNAPERTVKQLSVALIDPSVCAGQFRAILSEVDKSNEIFFSVFSLQLGKEILSF